MARLGSKAHLRELRTRARRELGAGAEPPTVEQLLRSAQAIDEAVHAQTGSTSFGRLMVADGWCYARTLEEFIEQRFGVGDRADWMRRARRRRCGSCASAATSRAC